MMFTFNNRNYSVPWIFNEVDKTWNLDVLLTTGDSVEIRGDHNGFRANIAVESVAGAFKSFLECEKMSEVQEMLEIILRELYTFNNDIMPVERNLWMNTECS